MGFRQRTLVVLLFLLAAGVARPMRGLPAAVNLLAGLAAAAVVIGLESGLRRLDPAIAAGGLFGGFLGGGLGTALGRAFPPAYGSLVAVAAVWLGAAVGARSLPALLPGAARPEGATRPAFLLDSSALVDGRLPEIAQAGFLGERLVVPPFVLRELRGLADASDPAKRARGRRGLDSLERLRGAVKESLLFGEDDVPEFPEVDVKLAELARRTGARLLTLDANLRKVAAARGVGTASLNDLAAALRHAAQPGETVRLAIVKEGREPGQGVGHLEDGTMVVVENGRELLGKEAEVLLTNFVQTTAGRMFFARREG